MADILESLETQIMAAGSAGGRNTRFKFDQHGEEVRGIQEIAKGFVSGKKAIARDKRFTATGRDEKHNELVGKTLAELEAWEAGIPARLSNRIEIETAALRRKLEPEPQASLDSAERLVREIRHSEIRRSLERFERTMLELQYATFDEETREAIRTAPRGVVPGKDGVPVQSPPLVSAAVIEKHDVAAMKNEFPEETAEIDELRDLRDTYQTLGDIVRLELEKTTSPSVEELAAAATAEADE